MSLVALRTSETHPLAVDWVEGLRVGLTFAPGKHAPSFLGDYRWARDLGADLDRLVGHHRADVLACLLEDHELPRLRIPGLVAEAEARGLRVLRLPIPDGGVPADPAALSALVRALADEVRAGRSVVIHCRGGLGRTGLVGGCLLVELGRTPAEAIAALHAARGPQCPENARQCEVISRYAATVS